MKKITIPKDEYNQLQKQAKAYKKLTSQLFEFMLVNDPVKEVVEDFKKTDLYSSEFLEDLEKGLRKSSYSKSKK